MVKLENVLGGSVQFHFNIAEKLHKIVVIAEGVTTVYDEDEVLAMLKVWNHLGEALESDKMAVDLVNGCLLYTSKCWHMFLVRLEQIISGSSRETR